MRALDTATLDAAAKHYAAFFLFPDRVNPKLAGRHSTGPAYVMENFHNFTFADEFDYLVEAIHGELGGNARGRFDDMAKRYFTPRDDNVFHGLLASKLAITPDGEHMEGRIGTTKVGGRRVGSHVIEVEAPWSVKRRRFLGLDKSHREVITRVAAHNWPIYAGEQEERQRPNEGAADPLIFNPVMALNTRISNECALLGCDAIVDNLDEGSAGATIQGRTGAQPADPDTAVTGTNLFTLTCSTTAFGAAADAAPGAVATAAAITDDSSADATGTLGYCRASSSNAADTPLDDHIDGEAGTSGADWNFNTLAITSGATVSATSWTVTLPES